MRGAVIASEATKQSRVVSGTLDCFAEFIIGRCLAPTRWLAMTCWEHAFATYPSL
jgi:hypothetical protein